MTKEDFIRRSALENAAHIIAASEGLSLGDIANTAVNMAIVLADEIDGRICLQFEKHNKDLSFDERCEIVRKNPITSDMSYEERLAAQKARFGV